MASLQEVEAAFMRADQAGDTAAASVLAGEVERLRAAAKPRTLADQIGLTARAGIKGVAALPAIAVDAMTAVPNFAMGAYDALRAPRMSELVTGKQRGYRIPTTAVAIDGLLDRIGLPKPRDGAERIASTGAEMMSGAGAAAKIAQMGARAVGEAAPVAREVLSRLAADPTQQIVAAGAGGVAGQQAKEAGAGALGQFVSAAGGTVLGAGALGLGRAAVDGVKQLLPRSQQIQLNRVDQTINVSLQANGIDPATITPAMRSSLREQVAQAMRLGQLDENAVARLADYTRLGTTPTRGRLTLDPFDITQEQNASKLAAAMGQRDAQLPSIANENNTRMLSTVDGFNPLADRFLTGQRAMAPIQATDRALESGKTAAYQAAERMAGGEIPLQRGGLNGVYGKLNAERKLRFVPQEVMGTIDDILNDTRAPFTVNQLDELKTTIATAMRGTQDGNVRRALGIVREHLDGMPMTPEKTTFGGNQVVTSQGANFLRSQDAQAGELKAALDTARGLNFNWRTWQRSAPGIEAAVNDANPETFVKNFIRNQNADARDVERAARVINTSPDARNAVRSELVQALKDAAIGKGNGSQSGNFSGRAWASALDGINVRKLGLFFEPEEIETLRALGRVGTYEVFQPRGSAVNNSNTAAGVAGLLQGVLKYAKPRADKLPFGAEIITNPLQNITLSVMQRGATNVPQSLVLKPQNPRSLLDPLVFPATLGGGLLAQ